MKLIFATHNPDKLKEMKSILRGLKVEVLSAKQAGIKNEVVEDKKTLEENALKKAKFVAKQAGLWAVADDSGLFIDALNGAPGVLSKRWAGKKASGKEMVQFTLNKMKGFKLSQRKASFISVAALADPAGRSKIFKGKISGKILFAARGKSLPQMPYDAIFQPTGSSKTFAEMPNWKKNSLSHRGRAFQQMKKYITNKILIHEK